MGFTHVELEALRISGGDNNMGEDTLVRKCETGQVTQKQPGLAGA